MTDRAIIVKDGATAFHTTESTATVDSDGGVNIPTGQTYDINGTPHTHTGLATYDSDVVFQAITTGNADSDNHGFLPALSGDSDTWLDGLGEWTTPPSLGASGRTLLSEQTPSGTGAVSFTSISGSYKKLVLEFAIRSTQAATNVSLVVSFNGDTTDANYRMALQEVYGTNSGSNLTNNNRTLLADNVCAASSPSNAFSIGIIEIPQYANTNFEKAGFGKMVHRRDSSSVHVLEARAGFQWFNTAAITQIDVDLSAGNYVANSVLRLYGEN